MHAIIPLLQQTFPRITRRALTTLQVNLGYRCNQSCLHCHVNAGPNRKEAMSAETIEQVLAFARGQGISAMDLTGGAPELNPGFRHLVVQARAMGIRVLDRCNLTILQEPGHEDLAGFLAQHTVEVVASLPCYLEDNVDAQRGKGVFTASIAALQRLNALGYGSPDSGLTLNLVYNPQGASLPPPQGGLEADYKARLAQYGVHFNHLFVLANMPIQRFGSTLVSRGQFDTYMDTLRLAHRPENLDSVMCKDLVSVRWDGTVFDCDFNQMLDLPLRIGDRQHMHLQDLLDLRLEGNAIAVRDHCFGCTAGQGSSCGGALAG